MSEYNYDAFSPDDYDFRNSGGPQIGDRARDFDIETPDGKIKKLLDFEGEYLVLEMGSITCPLFHSRRDKMLSLDQEFPDLSFAVLYVREAHPGADIPSHQSMADKKACASRLKTEDGDNRLILVDSLEGSAHEAFGSFPNSVFIIDRDGIVRFQSDWNNPTVTRTAITKILAGENAPVKSVFFPASPKIVRHTAKRAGEGSASDFLKGLPRLFWGVFVIENLKTVFGRK